METKTETLLAALAQFGPKTVGELAILTGYSRSTVIYNLGPEIHAGNVMKYRVFRSVYFRLTEEKDTVKPQKTAPVRIAPGYWPLAEQAAALERSGQFTQAAGLWARAQMKTKPESVWCMNRADFCQMAEKRGWGQRSEQAHG
jgi:DNA-binding transcriptional ArsR family regulator